MSLPWAFVCQWCIGPLQNLCTNSLPAMNKSVKINEQIIPFLYNAFSCLNNNSWGWGFALVVLGLWRYHILIWDTFGRINENNMGTFKTKPCQKKRKVNNILDLPRSGLFWAKWSRFGPDFAEKSGFFMKLWKERLNLHILVCVDSIILYGNVSLKR